jgi:large subunit ribosomal protein L13e
MVKHNNIVPNVHFHKEWDRRVKLWFDQPAQKKARKLRRLQKLKSIFPRPLGNLKPAVHSASIRHNHRVRLGRGFTLEELKSAGIHPRYARTIGISVDHRRRNKSEESLALNVQRLNEYKSKLVLFPRNSKKTAKGEASAEELAKVTQLKGTVLPLKTGQDTTLQVGKIADYDSKTRVFEVLRRARADAKMVGIRQEKAKKKAAAEVKP